MPFTILVTGNMGVGKTTFATILADILKFQLVEEPVESNPFLSDFYVESQRWAFHVEVEFLRSKASRIRSAGLRHGSIVLDRSPDEDINVFSRMLLDQGILEEREFAILTLLSNDLSVGMPSPDVVIFLKADIEILIERIRRRGRTYEYNLPISYLVDLQTYYENWSAQTTLPVIHVDTTEVQLGDLPRLAEDIAMLLDIPGEQPKSE